ncbi:hypothetical protein [Variovorax sp. LjRoot178]|uniref:hypothetical protein n=1 Tax=Variovorax sp. LjRoot178 TaxID=3342277 RepID=UPI003ECFA987
MPEIVEADTSLRVQLLLGERDRLWILSVSEVQLYHPLGLLEHVRMTTVMPSPDIGAIWQAERAALWVSRFFDAFRAEAAISVSEFRAL